VKAIALALGWMLAVAAIAPAAGAEGTAPTPSYGPAEWRSQLAMDRTLGEQASQELLAQLQLPPGAVPTAAEPAGGGTYLALRAPGPGVGMSDAQGWFTVPGTTAQVLAYIAAHEPPGALPSVSPRMVEDSSYIDIAFPPVSGELAAKQLGVFVARLPEGGVGVLAHAQVLWVVPRERIPARVRAVLVTLSPLRGLRPREHTYPLLGSRRTAQLRAQLEALAPHRPSFQVMSCPAPVGSIELAFLASRRGGALAHATITVGGCGGVSLTVEGNEQPHLLLTGAVTPLNTLERWLRLTFRG